MRLAPLLLLGLVACHPLDVGAPEAEAAAPALADAPAALVRPGQGVNTGALRLIDGDTFALGAEHIRIENIDTPEMPPRSKCLAEARLAVVARRELGDVLGQGWGIVPTLDRHGRDRYGRTLAAVRLPDGTDVGAEMVKRGVAVEWTGHRADWCGQ